MTAGKTRKKKLAQSFRLDREDFVRIIIVSNELTNRSIHNKSYSVVRSQSESPSLLDEESTLDRLKCNQGFILSTETTAE